MMKYEHYIFDLYGTLVDIHTDEDAPGLWEKMADYYRVRGAAYEPEELHTAYLRLVEEAESIHPPLRQDAHEAHPEILIELVFARLYRDKGVTLNLPLAVETGRQFRKLSTDYLRLYDGARELLTALRDQGAKLWLLSNAQAIFTNWELEQLDLTSCFDGIYLSSDYGTKKPDRRFFNRLLLDQHIDPHTAVMIGNDGICDVQGGRDAGLATVYLRSNLSPDEPLPQADFVQEHLDLYQLQNFLLPR